MHHLGAELSTLALPQKEVKIGPRASRAHCHSQAWAPGLTLPAQGRAEIQRGSWRGRTGCHQLEKTKKKIASLISIFRPSITPWHHEKVVPASRYTLTESFAAPCPQLFRIYPKQGLLGFSVPWTPLVIC